MEPYEGIKRQKRIQRQKIKHQKSKKPIYTEPEMTGESDGQAKSGNISQKFKKPLLKLPDTPANSGDGSELERSELLYSQVSVSIVYDVPYIMQI